MDGFMKFIKEQGVVGLAIGLIMGGAVGKLVESLVTNILNPVVGMFLGPSVESLSTLSAGTVVYGGFISSMIDFVIICAVVYFIFKGLKLDELDEKKEE